MTTEIKETISRASSGPLLAGPTKIRGWGRSSMTKLAFTGQALNGRSRQDLPAASDQLRTSKVGAATTGFAETGHSSRMILPDWKAPQLKRRTAR